MAIGTLSTLLFYWLVRQKPGIVEENSTNRQIIEQEDQSQDNDCRRSTKNDRQIVDEDLTSNKPSCSRSLNNKTAARRKISPTKGSNGDVNCTYFNDENVSEDAQVSISPIFYEQLFLAKMFLSSFSLLAICACVVIISLCYMFSCQYTTAASFIFGLTQPI